jgi:hypothetical protein
MTLISAELAYVRSQGLFIREKCDGCGKVLNQAIRYTIANKPQVYCSAACRDLAFFVDRHQARKYSSPGKCANCGAPLQGKRRGALYCDESSKKRLARMRQPIMAARVKLSGTVSNEMSRLRALIRASGTIAVRQDGNVPRASAELRQIHHSQSYGSRDSGPRIQPAEPIKGERFNDTRWLCQLTN